MKFLYSVAILALLSTASMASTLNCTTNWIGGACGVTTNNGHSTTKIEPVATPPAPPPKDCEHDDEDEGDEGEESTS